MARSLTNGSAFVAGSVRRRISSMVDSWSMGAEYASRRNGVSLEEFDRDLTATAPSHVLVRISCVDAFSAANRKSTSPENAMVLTEASHRDVGVVRGRLGSLVGRRAETVQIAWWLRGDNRGFDATDPPSVVNGTSNSRRISASQRYPATSAGKEKPRQVNSDRRAKKNAAHTRHQRLRNNVARAINTW